MIIEEQKWLVEKLGGCWHECQANPDGFYCCDCAMGVDISGDLNRPNGYEWVRQKMCKLGLMEPFTSFVEELYQRPAYTLLSLTPAEKTKLIYDFLKEAK
jgi:hypothetical protein